MSQPRTIAGKLTGLPQASDQPVGGRRGEGRVSFPGAARGVPAPRTVAFNQDLPSGGQIGLLAPQRRSNLEPRSTFLVFRWEATTEGSARVAG